MIYQTHDKLADKHGLSIKGHIKIYDPYTKEVFIDKPNAIHYENFSLVMANSLSGQGIGITEMCFGTGGTRIDDTGIITYLTPNAIDTGASLYNQTYVKEVDSNLPGDLNPAKTYMQVRHAPGAYYSDILVSCYLDYGEPAGEQAFANDSSLNGTYTFDELGLRTYGANGPGTGLLLTHVIFHPVQKSLNRTIQIDYTIRVQSLTS
jgi:hypothetical protein